MRARRCQTHTAGRVWCQVHPSRESKREILCPAFARPLSWGLLGKTGVLSGVLQWNLVVNCLWGTSHPRPHTGMLWHWTQYYHTLCALCSAWHQAPHVPLAEELSRYSEDASGTVRCSGSPRAVLQPWERPGLITARWDSSSGLPGLRI